MERRTHLTQGDERIKRIKTPYTRNLEDLFNEVKQSNTKLYFNDIDDSFHHTQFHEAKNLLRVNEYSGPKGTSRFNSPEESFFKKTPNVCSSNKSQSKNGLISS